MKTDGEKSLWSLRELLESPEICQPRTAVVPYLAWAGRVTLLSGLEKLGKSTLATAATVAVSRGGFFLDREARPGRVLILSLEEHMNDVVARLESHGANPDSVFVADRTPGDPASGLGLLVEESSPDLVVIDTLAALADSRGPDPGDSSAWTRIMGGITRVAREDGPAILLLHHARKRDGAYRDSTAIGAGVDVIAEMREGKKANWRRITCRGRWRLDDLEIAFDDDEVGPSYSLIGRQSVADQVVEALRGSNGLGARELRKVVGGRATEVDKACDELIEDRRVERTRHGRKCHYRLL